VVLGPGVGHRGVRQRKLRVERHGIVEHLQPELEVLPGEPACVALAAQVEVVGLHVPGRLDGQLGLLLRGQGDAQRLGNLARDLVLHLEDVLHLAVVPLRPQRKVGARVDELRVDPQAAAGPAQAAREHVGGRQLLADLGRGHRPVPIGQHRRPREDLHPPDLREFRDDVLGDAVAEVLVLLHAAQVLEIHDRERRLGRLDRAAPARAVGRAVPSGIEVAPDAMQVGLQLGRGLVPETAVFLERLLQQPAERLRQPGGRLRRRGRIPVENGVEHDRRRVALKRQDAGRHLIQDGTEREQIGARVGELAARLLGRHVRHRAQRRARRGQVDPAAGFVRRAGARSRLAGTVDLREPEVEDLHLPARVHEDVRRLDVPVDDALRVCRLERVGHLGGHVHELRGVESPASDQVRQRLALEQLHHDEVLPLVLVDGVDGADVRVVEGGGRPRLALEALERLRVAPEIGRQELQRDPATQLRVLRLVDHAHAPAAERPDDFVVRDVRADHADQKRGLPMLVAPDVRSQLRVALLPSRAHDTRASGPGSSPCGWHGRAPEPSPGRRRPVFAAVATRN
jgi:hypothetical protein